MKINRYSKKTSRYERQGQRREYLEYVQKGEGLYVYRNRHKEATLDLPKPTKSGRTWVGPNEEWQGDNYYMGLVRSGEAVLVREIYSPEEERKMNNQNLQEQKLIVDQPDTVTEAGTVEHVIPTAKPAQALTEGQPAAEQTKDVLLNENPLTGVEIILHD